MDDALTRCRDLRQPAFISLQNKEKYDAATEAARSLPLESMPIAVKDNIDVAGFATTVGFPKLITPADRDATVVGRLTAAGAVVVGKTNLDQFATGLVGTRSPYGACHSIASELHVSGGSSSGSAIAVASRAVTAALGTDTAGSGRVPAAFNGIVGLKPTHGLVSTSGVFPASPSLDCVSIFSRDVATARRLFQVAAAFDATDIWSRSNPPTLPVAVARKMNVVAVPSVLPELEPAHQTAWEQARKHLEGIALVREVDVTCLLEAAQLLYGSGLIAERFASFGHLLVDDDPGLDPTVRQIVLAAGQWAGHEVSVALQQLQGFRQRTAALFGRVDAVLLPVTPMHPTLDQVGADPIGVNARLGTFTNMVNLLDLCAIAVPSGERDDGLPFGVQLLAPAFADLPLMDLASRWTGESAVEAVSAEVEVTAGRSLLAVAGAHLVGQPLNRTLLEVGGRLHERSRTAGGYRMFSVPGPIPRPGLVDTGDGPARGFEIELWDLPTQGIGAILQQVSAPLALGQIRLYDDRWVTGFVASLADLTAEADISHVDGWRDIQAPELGCGGS